MAADTDPQDPAPPAEAERAAEAPADAGALQDAAPAPAATTPDEPATEPPVPPVAEAPAPARSFEALMADLTALFPALFAAEGAPRPIKLRIQVDIQQRAAGRFTRRELSCALGRHTTRTAYLRALVQASERFDLDGQAAGAVSDEHRQAAVDELARRKALHDERRAAERARQRESARPPGDRVEAGDGARPARPPRGPRRDDKRPQPGARDARPGGPPLADRPARPPRPRRPPRPDHPPRRDAAHASPPREAPAAPAPVVETDPARRERALLLHAFEASPLSKANFCALKRMREAELDAQLELAREERRARGGADAQPRRSGGGAKR